MTVNKAGARLVSVAAFVLVAAWAVAAEPGVIHLKTGPVDTREVAPAALAQAEGAAAGSDDGPRKHYLVHATSHSAIRELAAEWKPLGAAYIPDNTLLVYATAGQIQGLARPPAVDWVGEYLPAYKIAPSATSAAGVAILLGSDEGAAVSRALPPLCPECVVEEAGGRKVLLRFPAGLGPEGRRSVLEGVAALDSVVWIEQIDVFGYRNKFATSILAHGGKDTAPRPATDRGFRSQPEGAVVPGGRWEGLDGAGQVIGVADSGLDWDSCFFYDDQHEVPYDRVDPDGHRKIVTYTRVDGADQQDFYMGHGTHVMGSIAGHVLYPKDSKKEAALGQYNGMAPGAKLAILGIGNHEGKIFVPKDLYRDLFPYAYAAGARIHTNSWSGGLNEYSISCAEIDRYTWEHPDFLPLFAAGNDGSSGPGSVRNPGTAKNILTVGATQSSPDVLLEYVKSNLTFSIENIRVGLCEGNHQYFDEGFCGKIGKEAPCSEMQPILCKEFTTPAACCKYPIDPMKCCPEYILRRYHEEPALFNSENLAAFSSRGPTRPDGRIKPEVVAPGKPIFSSRSDGDTATFQCGEDPTAPDAATNSFDGTSMATPLVAGSVALIRQYLTGGYHPTGAPVPAHRVPAPSAALLKALVVASASPLTGLVEGSLKPIDCAPGVPSMTQGFGRVQLDRVLSGPTSKVNLSFQEGRLEKSGDTAVLCLQRTSPAAAGLATLKATLVWTDPPAAPSASQVLVNDLDLAVSDARTGAEHRGNGGPAYDDTNNAEQVVVSGGGETMLVHVHARRVVVVDSPGEGAAGAQPYAVVVTGDYTAVDCATLKPAQPWQCPGACFGRGRCDAAAGRCACGAGYGGLDCSLALCPGDCRGHGKCNGDSGKCVCADGYGGASCNVRVCPNDCSGHGTCDTSTGVCRCDDGFSGAACKESMCPLDCSDHGRCQADGECACDGTRIGTGCCGLKEPLVDGSTVLALVPHYSLLLAYVDIPTDRPCHNITITLRSTGGGPKLWVTSTAAKFETCQLNTCTEDDFEFRDDAERTGFHAVTVSCGKPSASKRLLLQVPNEGNDDSAEDFQNAACQLAVSVAYKEAEEGGSGPAVV